MLVIEFSSAFNTIMPTRLTAKIVILGLKTTVCLGPRLDRTQVVKVGSHTIFQTPSSSTLVPPMVVSLAPLYIHKCLAKNRSDSIDTIMEGLIHNSDKKAYPQEVTALSLECQVNSLCLNVNKNKGLVVDLERKQQENCTVLRINGTLVERESTSQWTCHGHSTQTPW